MQLIEDAVREIRVGLELFPEDDRLRKLMDDPRVQELLGGPDRTLH